jgi:hypothetical protein
MTCNHPLVLFEASDYQARSFCRKPLPAARRKIVRRIGEIGKRARAAASNNKEGWLYKKPAFRVA